MDAVKVPYREYADLPLVFTEVPDWLQDAVEDGRIVPDFRSEDYWYFEVRTLDGIVDAAPGDLIVNDGGNLAVYTAYLKAKAVEA